MKKCDKFLLIPAIIFMLVFTGCSNNIYNQKGQSIEKNEFLMDTVVGVRIHGDDKKELSEIADKMFQILAEQEVLLSRHVSDSDVSRINDRAGISSSIVSDDTIEVITTALKYGELTEGAFDITISPLIDLWELTEDGGRVPSQEEIDAVLPLINYNLIEIDVEKNEVFLPQEGMTLDLGGIAKGYIVDIGVEFLKSKGIESAYLDGGGDIRVIGARLDGTPWRMGIRNPRKGNDILAVIELEDKAIVTSGDYERYFEKDGRRYHHILDPATGYPPEEVASVTIVGETAMETDILSTAIFVMGLDKGLELLEGLDGIDGVIITANLDIHITSGLEDKIEIRE